MKIQKECHLQVKGYLRLPEARRGLEQIFLSQPSEGTNSVDTLILDF